MSREYHSADNRFRLSLSVTISAPPSRPRGLLRPSTTSYKALSWEVLHTLNFDEDEAYIKHSATRTVSSSLFHLACSVRAWLEALFELNTFI